MGTKISTASGFLATFAISAGLGFFSPGAIAADNCLVRIGGVVVGEEDVQLELQKRIPMQVSFHGGMKEEKLEQLKKAAHDAVVARAYKVQYATDKKLAVNDEAVEEELARLAEKNPAISKATAAQKTALKSDLRMELLARKAEEEAVGNKAVVSENEVKDYYEINKEKYSLPKLYKASHILVKIDPAASAEQKEAKRQKAEELYKRAKAGEDFYNLAYYESDDRSRYVGGSLGSFHAGRTVQEFDRALDQMKAGEISSPVQTIYGLHIIKLDEVQPPKQLSYDEAKDKIRKALVEQKRKQLYEDWMAALRQKYPAQNCAN